MRLFLAAIFVFGGLLLVVFLLSDLWEKISPIWLGIIAAFALFVFTAIAVVVFNTPWRRATRYVPLSEQIAQLEQQGLLVSTSFRAVRAFQVVGYDDECPHYFLDLENQNVLYLFGQYLDDFYSDSDADEEAPDHVVGRFPCTDFTILRHRDKGYVLDIKCPGDVLFLETVELAPDAVDYFVGMMPHDGGIITDRSYDALKTLLGEKL